MYGHNVELLNKLDCPYGLAVVIADSAARYTHIIGVRVDITPFGRSILREPRVRRLDDDPEVQVVWVCQYSDGLVNSS